MLQTQDILFQATIDGPFELFIPHNSFIYFQHATLEFLALLALLCHVETKQMFVTDDANVQQLIIVPFTTIFEFNLYRNVFENTETINLDYLDIQYLYIH